MNVKKTKNFKENRPENYHVHDRDLSTNKTQFFRLMRMGILDGREGYDMPMTATREMRHTVAVCSRLFVMFEHERQQVRCLRMSD